MDSPRKPIAKAKKAEVSYQHSVLVGQVPIPIFDTLIFFQGNQHEAVKNARTTSPIGYMQNMYTRP